LRKWRHSSSFVKVVSPKGQHFYDR
jgi:hypothetical protein